MTDSIVNPDKHATIEERFRSICRRNNWRRTAQRRAVFAYLDGNGEHPTVETVRANVRKNLPEISLDSVYRILDEFAVAGLVQRLEGSRAIRYDPDVSRHAHFFCVSCGGVFDFRFDADESVAEACRKIGTAAEVELSVRGVCADCDSLRV